MRALLNVALLSTWITLSGIATAQQPAGSRLPPDENNCAACHGEEALWEGENLRLFVPSEQLAEDVHWKAGVNCHDCHGGDPGTFSVPQAHAVQIDVAQTTATPFKPALSDQDRTAARLETQVQTCGKCHPQAVEEYLTSTHGQGLRAAGLVVTAVCTDCHGSHGTYPAADPRSTLHPANVSATCASCHRFIHERVQKSVHGIDAGPAGPNNDPAPGVDTKPTASCIDCHQGHDLPHPRSPAFRLAQPQRCGTCHADLTRTYTHSLHGKLTELGYLPAARCSDCHGSHDIVPIADPASPLSPINRRETCAKCHTWITDNFLDFDPHADPRDAQRNPLLYWVNVGVIGLLIGVFSLFGLHSVLWLIRGLLDVAKRGRPESPSPGALAYVRFRPMHRIAHTVLMISFLGLALTGLPLKYSHYEWAQTLSWALGGFQSTGLWHRIFGVVNISCLVFYCLLFGGRIILGTRNGAGRASLAIGPDSPVPNRRDLSDFGKMLRWFVGRGPKPTFERWTYWEKFDFWAASADIVLIGSTGIILWFPSHVCLLLPGQTINIASVIHSQLALLATGFVFSVHFFNTHLRPEKFPMDMSILTGLVSVEELEEERPEMVKRLRESGQFEQRLVRTPSRGVLRMKMLGGFIALSVGVVLLLAILISTFRLPTGG